MRRSTIRCLARSGAPLSDAPCPRNEAGKGTTLSSEKMIVSGRYGKVGGENFHHIGSLFTGPADPNNPDDPQNDQGKKTVFHGNLIGRALEAWTSKYSLNAREAHSAHISNFATVAKTADKAGFAPRIFPV